MVPNEQAVGVEVPDWLRDMLVKSGAAAPVSPSVVTVEKSVPVGVAKKGKGKVLRTTQGFVEPSWFKRLRMAMCVAGQHGACLFGPRGTGKTRALHELAKAEGVPLEIFQAFKGADYDSLLGGAYIKDGSSGHTDGPLVRAIREDCWLAIEEANYADPSVFGVFNTLIDGSGTGLLLRDGTRLPVGPRFRLVLLFNEGSAYAGTKQVNAATRDRLMSIFTNYMQPKPEAQVLMAVTGCDQDTADRLVNYANAIRAARDSLDFDFSPRAMFNMLAAVREVGATWEEAHEWNVLDLLGDPSVKKPQRDSVLQIAAIHNLSQWPAPTFSLVDAPEEPVRKVPEPDTDAAENMAAELV